MPSTCQPVSSSCRRARPTTPFYNNGYLALEYIRNIWYSSDPASKATRDAALAKDRDTPPPN
eukprot:scaffold17399_cov122-Isochrysis_galbana.AAC.1